MSGHQPDISPNISQHRYPSDHDSQVLESERRHIWRVDGVEITGSDYPECLDRTHFDCDDCSFFFRDGRSDQCRLRKHRLEREQIWEDIQPLVIYERRRAEIGRVLQYELHAHGRELHYSVLTAILRERYPHLNGREHEIADVMRSTPKVFEKVSPGVYKVGSSHRPTRE